MKALIIDDDVHVTKAVSRLLGAWGLEAETAGDFKEALARYQALADQLGLVLLDYQLPEGTGLQLLPKLLAIDSQVPIILVTGYGSGPIAAQAMKLGAVDFVEKPFQTDALKHICLTAVQRRKLTTRLTDEDTVRQREETVFASQAMAAVGILCERVANVDINVLLTGETGVGKEVLARHIHGISARKTAPFVAINCAAIPKDLLESELFGFRKGAFTGADRDHPGMFRQAGKGTLFLDEIGDMPLDLQAKLLRVIQEKTVQALGDREPTRVEARLLAATHADLAAKVRAGEFREDLFYRINQFSILVPPLRERPEAVPALVTNALEAARRAGVAAPGVSQGVLEALASYSWPGNVRQLENVVLRAAILAGGQEIEMAHLPPELLSELDIRPPEISTAPASSPPADIPMPADPEAILTLAEIERRAILAAIDVCGGNVAEAARRLGSSRATLYRKLDSYGIKSDAAPGD